MAGDSEIDEIKDGEAIDASRLELVAAADTADAAGLAGWPWRGLIVALVAHGALIGALLWRPGPDGGAGGVALDAIEIAVVDGRALETLLAAARSDAAALPAVAEPETSSGEAAPEAAAATTEKPRDIAAISVPDSALRLPLTPPVVDPPKASAETKQTSTQAASDAQPEAGSGASAAGAEARGTDPAAVADAAGTRAPPGVVNDYAISVATALARNKPRAPGPKGTARVRFTVAPDGRVSDAEVLETSGSSILDAAALATVRRTQFPRPPVILTRLETTYILPFHFR